MRQALEPELSWGPHGIADITHITQKKKKGTVLTLQWQRVAVSSISKGTPKYQHCLLGPTFDRRLILDDINGTIVNSAMTQCLSDNSLMGPPTCRLVDASICSTTKMKQTYWSGQAKEGGKSEDEEKKNKNEISARVHVDVLNGTSNAITP